MNEEIEQTQEVSVNKKRLKRQMSTLAWGVFALAMGAQLLAVIPSYIFSKLVEMGFNRTLGTWLTTDISIYGIGLPMLYLIIKDLPKQKPTKQNQDWKFTKYLVAILIGLGGLYLLNFLSVGLTTLIAKAFHQEVSTIVQDSINSTGSIITFIFVVLIAPVGEELIFRKLLIDRSIQYGERYAILFSALCFGLFHGNFNQLFYAIFLGMIFGYLYVKTADIKYCIFAHFGANLLGSFLIPLLITNEAYQKLGTALIFVFIIIGVILFILNIKKVKLNDGELPLTNKEKRNIMFKNAAFIIYTTIMIIFAIVILLLPYIQANISNA